MKACPFFVAERSRGTGPRPTGSRWRRLRGGQAPALRTRGTRFIVGHWPAIRSSGSPDPERASVSP